MDSMITIIGLFFVSGLVLGYSIGYYHAKKGIPNQMGNIFGNNKK